jgi:large subunit ribosomal protein L23
MNAKAATAKAAKAARASKKSAAAKKSATSKTSATSRASKAPKRVKAAAVAKTPAAAKTQAPARAPATPKTTATERTPVAAKPPAFDQERLLQVLIAPQISEKSTFVGEKNNQWVFRVLPDASKPEIKAAVEMMFKVQVQGVQTLNTQGKRTRRFGRPAGRRRNWKKAFVSLKQGQEISFTPGEAK